MKLSRIERVMLAHQMRILEHLVPEEVDYFQRAQTALEQGFEGEYDELFGSVYPEGMTAEECHEVYETLAMFSFLRDSYDKLTDKTGIDEYAVSFHGYDGNNETSFMCFVEYIYEGDRFTDLLKKKPFNSHAEMRDVYGRMLEKFDVVTSGKRSQEVPSIGV